MGFINIIVITKAKMEECIIIITTTTNAMRVECLNAKFIKVAIFAVGSYSFNYLFSIITYLDCFLLCQDCSELVVEPINIIVQGGGGGGVVINSVIREEILAIVVLGVIIILFIAFSYLSSEHSFMDHLLRF